MCEYIKDPDSVTDYAVDWTEWLAEKTIQSSSWIVPAGLVNEGESFIDDKTAIVLSGGTLNACYEVVNHIITNEETAGVKLEEDKTLYITVKNK